MEQSRFSSPVLWSSLAAQVLVILVTLGVIDTGLSEAITAVVTSVLQLLVAFGVLNNPTSKSHF
ncbi:MAG: holin [Clostridia bacterium]|nr:holin [Clostridia bacterium]